MSEAFGLSDREVQEIKGLINQNCTVHDRQERLHTHYPFKVGA